MFLAFSLIDKFVVFNFDLEKPVSFLVRLSFRKQADILRVFVFFLGYKTFLESQEPSEINFLVFVQLEQSDRISLCRIPDMAIDVRKHLGNFSIDFFSRQAFFKTII